MEIIVTLEGNNSLIPFAYQHYLQGLIYSCIDDDLASSIHDKGLTYQDKSFKMFTYSQLKGDYTVVHGMLKFNSDIKFHITSFFKDILNSIYVGLSSKEYIEIGKSIFKIKSIKTITEDKIEDNVQTYHVRTLSPIINYTTDKKKFATYHDPHTELFEELLKNNLFRKYGSIFNEEPVDEVFEVVSINKQKHNVCKYKNTVYTGYTLDFEVKASYNFMKIALHTGLGSKNASGFGMIEIV